MVDKFIAAAQKLKLIEDVLNGIDEVVTVLGTFGDVAGIQTSIDTINTKLSTIAENANNYVHPNKHSVTILDGSLNVGKFIKVDNSGATGFDVIAWSDINGKPSSFTPSSHTHDFSEIATGTLEAARVSESSVRQFVTAVQKAQFNTMESTDNKGQAGGYTPLGSNGKIPSEYIDSLDILDVHEASNEATMLALSSAGKSDICVRSDYPSTAAYPTYLLKQLPASTLANWVGINSSAGVSAVNGKVGVVNLSTSDISEGLNLYFTSPRVIAVVRSLLEAGTNNVSFTYNEGTSKLALSVDGYTQTEVNNFLLNKADKATTLSGYGITDAYTQSQVISAIASAIANLVNSSPAALDTLNELASALGNDANFATTMANALAGKVSKDSNTGVAFLPFGTTAQRPTLTSSDRAIRYNTTLLAWESWDGASWGLLGGGVALSGNQTKDGILTFTSSPIVPVPTTIGQAIPMGAILEKTPVVMGYGTGAGGTVTQPTSKGTNITLNKPCGQITTSNSSIPSNGSYVYFALNNNLIEANDIVIVELSALSSSADPSYYEVSTFYVANSSVRIKIKNLSASALAETLVINFAVIKGATA